MEYNMTMKEIQEQLKEIKNDVENLKKSLNMTKKCLKDLKIGDTFKLSDIDWIILDITEKGYLCLVEKKLPNNKSALFDYSSNNWSESLLREWLGEIFLNSHKAVKRNVIEFERDLTTLNGKRAYGTCKDFVSLLTLDEYRKYSYLIKNISDFWWLATAVNSNTVNNPNTTIITISRLGNVCGASCMSENIVRPLCTFRPDTEIIEN